MLGILSLHSPMIIFLRPLAVRNVAFTLYGLCLSINILGRYGHVRSRTRASTRRGEVPLVREYNIPPSASHNIMLTPRISFLLLVVRALLPGLPRWATFCRFVARGRTAPRRLVC